MVESDLGLLDTFDSDCFGGKRTTFLRTRLTNYPEFCKVAVDSDAIIGYIMGSMCGSAVRIGPWVVREDASSAETLLGTFGAAAKDRVVKIGVLETNSAALHLLNKYGFTQTSYSWRMSTNQHVHCTTSDNLFAICSPARG
jgi:hypothetical protein